MNELHACMVIRGSTVMGHCQGVTMASFFFFFIPFESHTQNVEMVRRDAVVFFHREGSPVWLTGGIGIPWLCFWCLCDTS